MKFAHLVTLCVLSAACGKEAKPAAQTSPAPAPVVIDERFLQSDAKKFRALLTWDVAPVAGEESVARIELRSIAGAIDSSLTLMRVKPWMSVHAHGAPVNKVKIEKKGDAFVVSGLYFVMGGPWELIASVESAEQGLKDDITFHFEVN